jgi:hypothetical protein
VQVLESSNFDLIHRVFQKALHYRD